MVPSGNTFCVYLGERMDSLDILAVVPPLGWMVLFAVFVAAMILALEWAERQSHLSRNRHAGSRWKDLEGQLSGLSRQLDEQKSENQLLNQHVQFFVDTLALDSFENDDARKRFLEAAGTYARNADLKPLLEVKGLSPAELGAPSLGLTAEEAEALLTLKSEWTVEGLLRISEKLRQRLPAIAAMEAVWTNENASADDHIRPIVRENMWVFEPDFVTADGRMWVDETIDAITHEMNADTGDAGARRRPDIVAEPITDYSLQANHQWQKLGRRSTMVIDLKNAVTQIRTAHQTQTWEYVRELIKRKAIPEHEPIDCYVIGGRVDEHEGGPRIEGWYQNVRIISCTYEQLIGRAKCLTLGLYDELAPIAPVLQPGYGQAQQETDVPVEAADASGEEPAVADAGAVEEPAAGVHSEHNASQPDDHHDDHHDDEHHDDDHHDDHHDDHAKNKKDGKHGQKPGAEPDHAVAAAAPAKAPEKAEQRPAAEKAKAVEPKTAASTAKVPPVQGVTGKPASKGGTSTRAMA